MTKQTNLSNLRVLIRTQLRQLVEAPGGRYSPPPRGQNTKGVIFLPTRSAMDLWTSEITGQLSDGYWENAKPSDHWHFWSNLVPRLGDPAVMANGHPVKDSYNLMSLIDVVGDRMLSVGRAAVSGADISRDAAEYMPGSFEEFVRRTKDGGYHAQHLKTVTPEAAKKFYATPYGGKDLRRDLSLIKQAMKNVIFDPGIDPDKVADQEVTGGGEPSSSSATGAAVVVVGMFRGKSKGPRGFERFKPIKYSNANDNHPIVYAKVFPSVKAATIAAKKATDEMRTISMSHYGGGYIKSYDVVVHDIDNDSTVSGDSHLLTSDTMSNDLLNSWGILSMQSDSNAPVDDEPTSAEPAAEMMPTELPTVAPPQGPSPATGSGKSYKIYGKKGGAPAHTRFKGKAFVAGKDTRFKSGDSATVSPSGNKLSVKSTSDDHTQVWEPEE